MALTSGELTICNQALALVGQTSIDSTDTSTKDTGTAGNPYTKCELIFDQTRNALLRSFTWNFAMVRLALVDDHEEETAYTTDQYVWEDDLLWKCNTAHYSGEWNSNLIVDGADEVTDDEDYLHDGAVTFYWTVVSDRPETYWDYRYALPADFSRFEPKWLIHNEYHFTVESNYILTDEDSLNINYIKTVSDTSEFDDLFTEVLIFDLAIKLTFTLMGASYQTQALRRELNTERRKKIVSARATNHIENVEGKWPSTNWVNARYGSGKV